MVCYASQDKLERLYDRGDLRKGDLEDFILEELERE